MNPRFLAGIGILFMIGCNRHDTDALSRIGRKIAAHTRSHTDELGGKLDLRAANTKKEPTLLEKIQDRIRFENTLTEVAIEVRVNEKEVELKGTVKTDLQRQRAIELAETVAGVDRVTNSLQVADAVP